MIFQEKTTKLNENTCDIRQFSELDPRQQAKHGFRSARYSLFSQPLANLFKIGVPFLFPADSFTL
jgi:hypothetical protein